MSMRRVDRGLHSPVSPGQSGDACGSHHQLSYRPEIDGLRAVAVIAVIINHIDKSVLPAGYLGVDIFFVISGYVITASLLSRGRQPLATMLTSFYARRIKRLLPALLVYVVVTSLFLCVVNPDPVVGLQSGIASLFGISNLYFLNTATDYFAQSTELNPFTHTWSLGVEEQFYFVFPFLFCLTGLVSGQRRSFFRYLSLLCLLTLASLWGFVLLYPGHQPAAYFLMPTRFWELASGSLALVLVQRSPLLRSALQRCPALLILAAIISVLWLPASQAVFATVATVLLSTILIASIRKGSPAFRLLSHPWMVFIGLISYSLYLWHWGILSISRWTIGISWWSIPLQLLLTFLIASASYHWIETPFRTAATPQRRLVFLVGAAANGLTTALLWWLTLPGVHARMSPVRSGEGVFQRGRQSQSNYVGPVTGRRNGLCGALASDLSPTVIAKSLSQCLWQGPLFKDVATPVVAIIGDSHAHQLFPVAENIAKEYGLPVYNFYYLNCIVPQDDARLTDQQCNKVNQVPFWLHEILNRPIIYVIASFADPIINFPSPAGQIRQVQAFQQAFRPLLNKGNTLVVVAPNPKFMDIDNAISDTCTGQAWSAFNPICRKDYTFAAHEQREQRRAYLQALADWAKADSRVSIVDPYWFLCDERDGLCHSRKAGASKYWDRSHLTVEAAESTYPLYRPAIKHLLHGLSSD